MTFKSAGIIPWFAKLCFTHHFTLQCFCTTTPGLTVSVRLHVTLWNLHDLQTERFFTFLIFEHCNTTDNFYTMVLVFPIPPSFWRLRFLLFTCVGDISPALFTKDLSSVYFPKAAPLMRRASLSEIKLIDCIIDYCADHLENVKAASLLGALPLRGMPTTFFSLRCVSPKL